MSTGQTLSNDIRLGSAPRYQECLVFRRPDRPGFIRVLSPACPALNFFVARGVPGWPRRRTAAAVSSGRTSRSGRASWISVRVHSGLSASRRLASLALPLTNWPVRRHEWFPVADDAARS